MKSTVKLSAVILSALLMGTVLSGCPSNTSEFKSDSNTDQQVSKPEQKEETDIKKDNGIATPDVSKDTKDETAPNISNNKAAEPTTSKDKIDESSSNDPDENKSAADSSKREKYKSSSSRSDDDWADEILMDAFGTTDPDEVDRRGQWYKQKGDDYYDKYGYYPD